MQRVALRNHGPGPVRIITAEGGRSYTPPVLLESGQEWGPVAGQDAVTVAAAFGTALLELVGLSPVATSDPCSSCDGAGCDGCGRSGRVVALAPEPPPLADADADLLGQFRAAWARRSELSSELRAFLREKTGRGVPAYNRDWPRWEQYEAACAALVTATNALAGVECL